MQIAIEAVKATHSHNLNYENYDSTMTLTVSCFLTAYHLCDIQLQKCKYQLMQQSKTQTEEKNK